MYKRISKKNLQLRAITSMLGMFPFVFIHMVYSFLWIHYTP